MKRPVLAGMAILLAWTLIDTVTHRLFLASFTRPLLLCGVRLTR